MSRDRMISLTEVSKSFAGSPVIKSLTFSISTGQTAVLIGPSGCGKSTILRLIVGLVTPDAGTIYINNESLTQDALTDIRHRIGYVIQDGGLFPHLDAKQNVSLMARYLGWNGERIAARLEQLRLLFQLPAQLMDRFPHELSGGQRQRISLMRALLLDPDLLLLDEPLGSLDPMVRFDLQRELRDIFNDLHKTVILVTHDMGEAAYFGDHILLLADGAIVQQGGMAELLQRPAHPFVERFIRAQRQPWQDFAGKAQ